MSFTIDNVYVKFHGDRQTHSLSHFKYYLGLGWCENKRQV